MGNFAPGVRRVGQVKNAYGKKGEPRSRSIRVRPVVVDATER
jgi:hypothetical protein